MSDIKEPADTGRPSKLTPEVIQIAKDYLKGFEDPYEIEYEYKVVPGKGIEEIPVKKAKPIPSVAGLCRRLKIWRKTIYRWYEERRSEEFCHILDELNHIQEEFLIMHGVTGRYNSAFAKFVSTNKTNMREKVDHVHENKDIKIDIPAEAIEI